MSQASAVSAPLPLETPIARTAQARPDSKVRFAAIDGLRGLACLGVLTFHCWIAFGKPVGPGIHLGRHHLGLSQIYDRGYGGVDLFFVLSAFCLSYPIFSKPKTKTNWGKYAVARVRRIVPPYWAALFVFGIMSLLVSPKVQAACDLHWPGTKTFVIHGLLFWRQTLLLTFWTLVLEWRWYFLFPLCIWLCRRSNGWVMLAVSIPISFASVYIKEGMDRLDLIAWTEGVFRYLPLFAMGLLACELAVSEGRNSFERWIVRNARWGLLLWIVVLFLTTPYAEEMHDWHGTLHRLTTYGPIGLFATVAGVRDRYIQRILSWRPLVSVGIFSYSLYLVHDPLVRGIGNYARAQIHSPALFWAMYLVLVPGAMILLAYLFFLAFERPFLARKPGSPPPAPATDVTIQTPALAPEAAAP